MTFGLLQDGLSGRRRGIGGIVTLIVEQIGGQIPVGAVRQILINAKTARLVAVSVVAVTTL